MAIVVDASVVAAHLLPDEEYREAAATILVRLDEEDGVVPPIFRYETRNILLMAKRRKRIDGRQLQQLLAELTDFALVQDEACNDANMLALADRLDLTIYDAAYLEVAKRRQLPLATFDEKLARAANAEQVVVLRFDDSSLV